VQQYREAGRALDQRPDRRAVEAEDQVAFPVAGHGTIVRLGRPLADHHLLGDELLAARLRASARHPQRAPVRNSRSASLLASFDTFGRLARRSACHCAVVARYVIAWLRVEALRRSSLEIVDADRFSRRAISRTPTRWACRIAISSRSANDR
jgi:hypothetical protein